MRRCRIEYERLKRIWYKNPEVTSTDVYAEESHRIGSFLRSGSAATATDASFPAEIDCRRTDRTHPMFMSPELDPSEPSDSPHPPSNIHVKKCADILTTYVFAADDRDYVQGMSDLLSPLYVVAEADEVMAFWGFGTLMERQKGNFLRDQSGMKRQLSELQALLALMDPQLHKHLGASSFPSSLGWNVLMGLLAQRLLGHSTSSSASVGSSAVSSENSRSTTRSRSGRSSGPTTLEPTFTSLSLSPSSRPTEMSSFGTCASLTRSVSLPFFLCFARGD